MKEILFSRRNQLIIYISVIFIAPFITCKYYLQPLIGNISQLGFNLFHYNIKTIPTTISIFILLILLFTFKHINRIRILSALFILSIILLAHYVADFYMGSTVYDIQNNWHYVAYAIFSYLMYCYLQSKEMAPARIIIYTFFAALVISTSDEFFQLNMTNRVFDLGDIAKDVLGSVIGLIFIFFIIENGKIIHNGWHFRQRKLSGYFLNPLSILFLELIFTLIFLCISSILTNKDFMIQSIFISIFVFIFIMFIFHFSKYKFIKYILSGLILLQLISFGIFYKKNITFNSQNLIIYKGILIPYFDIIIFENGFFRLADKKSAFNYVDLNKIYGFTNNILLIGSGETGKGGGGFQKNEKMQFATNTVKHKVIQILRLKNDNAVKMFNNLKRHNKKVVFILHYE